MPGLPDSKARRPCSFPGERPAHAVPGHGHSMDGLDSNARSVHLFWPWDTGVGHSTSLSLTPSSFKQE